MTTKLYFVTARRYIESILSGMVPTDALYDPIYDALAEHGYFMPGDRADLPAIAAVIRKIRAES